MHEPQIFPNISSQNLRANHIERMNFKNLKNNLYSPFHWFLHINGTFPEITVIHDVNQTELLNSLLQHYSFNESNIIRNETFNDEIEQIEIRMWAILVKKDFIIYFDIREGGVSLIYSNMEDHAYIKGWTEFILGFSQENVAKDGNESRISILSQTSFGLTFTDFKVPKPAIDISTHYNDDFSEVHEYILKRLETPNDSGLVLLHGLPGTGKTTYIRYLSFLLSKRMVFIPQEISNDLSSVNFVSFMLDYPNTILIIEDAENIVSDSSGRNFSISSLLNVTDGLLSDCLNIQIICTFNTDLRHIDKALLRRGRMIARYEFKKLAAEKANRLGNLIGIKKTIEHPQTLGDLYNMSDPGFSYSGRKKVGF